MTIERRNARFIRPGDEVAIMRVQRAANDGTVKVVDIDKNPGIRQFMQLREKLRSSDACIDWTLIP